MPLTLQVFETPQQFLQAIGNAANDVDNASMAIVLGAAHDASQRSSPVQNSTWIMLRGEYTDGDQTIQVLYEPSLATQATIWIVCCSHNGETYYITWSKKDAGILAIASQLVETIIDALVAIKASPILSAFGPKPLADKLLAGWSARVDPPLIIREHASITSRLAYITSSQYAEIEQGRQRGGKDGVHEVLDITTLAYDRDSPELKIIHSQLVECIVNFWGTISEEAGLSAAAKMIDEVLDRSEPGRLWICRATMGEGQVAKPETAGYLYTGRQTRNTVAIRNVYTKDAFRGKGIARELVAAACEFWLLEAEGNKKKQSVTLFVEPHNLAAMRTYLRSGFQIEEDIWERRGFDGVRIGSF